MKEEVCKEGEKRKVDWLLQRLRALEVRFKFLSPVERRFMQGWLESWPSQVRGDQIRREGEDTVLAGEMTASCR